MDRLSLLYTAGVASYHFRTFGIRLRGPAPRCPRRWRRRCSRQPGVRATTHPADSQNHETRNALPARRLAAGPDDARARGAGVPDQFVRLQEHGTRGQPVRVEGARQHLHAADEPDDRRAREARRARRVSSIRLSTSRRPATTSSLRATCTAVRTRSSTTSCRRSASRRNSSTPPIPRTSPPRSTEGRGRCSAKPSPTRPSR
jgi:hypothetical protein